MKLDIHRVVGRGARLGGLSDGDNSFPIAFSAPLIRFQLGSEICEFTCDQALEIANALTECVLDG